MPVDDPHLAEIDQLRDWVEPLANILIPLVSGLVKKNDKTHRQEYQETVSVARQRSDAAPDTFVLAGFGAREEKSKADKAQEEGGGQDSGRRRGWFEIFCLMQILNIRIMHRMHWRERNRRPQARLDLASSSD